MSAAAAAAAARLLAATLAIAVPAASAPAVAQPAPAAARRPKPKSAPPAVDWPARARAVPWSFAPTSTLDWAVRVDGFDVELVHKAGGRTTVEIRIGRGGKVRHRWTGTAETPLVVQGDTLYYVEHHPISSGATAVAVDLATGKPRWRTPLVGIGPIGHSKYRNQVWLQVITDAVIVLGHESGGDYVELLDPISGKLLASDRRK